MTPGPKPHDFGKSVAGLVEEEGKQERGPSDGDCMESQHEYNQNTHLVGRTNFPRRLQHDGTKTLSVSLHNEGRAARERTGVLAVRDSPRKESDEDDSPK